MVKERGTRKPVRWASSTKYPGRGAAAVRSAGQAVRSVRILAYIGVRLPTPKLTFARSLDDKTERIRSQTIRVFIRGTGRPELEQLRREGLYRWASQKLAAWKMRLRFATRPPTGYTVRVTYDYLGADSLAITRAAGGITKVVFGSAPANGKKVTAKYRTTSFHGLRVTWRPGTLDQQPIEGFTDLEQSRNPRDSVLAKDAALTY